MYDDHTLTSTQRELRTKLARFRTAPVGHALPRYRFDSLTQLGHALPDPELAAHADRTAGIGALWQSAPLEYSAAVDALKHGGRCMHTQEAAKQLTAQLTRLKGSLRQNGARMKMESAVAGAFPSVARALAGSPKAMTRVRRAPAPSPVVRMGFHIGRPSSMSERVVFARAAAILAIVEEVERSGARVELVAVWSNTKEGKQPHRSGDGINGLDMQCTVKRPNDYYTPEALAFALDPTMQRRAAWLMVAVEHYAFDKVTKGFRNSLGAQAPGASEGFDYFAPRPRSQATEPRWWYDHLRQLWGIDKAAA